MRISEFTVRVAGRELPCALAEPPADKLAADPALVLTFAGARKQALAGELYDSAARAFTDAGFRAVSFDLPNHGDRADPRRSPEIAGICEALIAGDDQFATFIEEGKALIDTCVAKGLAGDRPGGIYAYGVSRGGYCVLRLASMDRRITGVAAMAPVIDWRRLREFARHKDDPKVAALDLLPHAKNLARQQVYIAIGSRDDRVGADRCADFVAEVVRAQMADPAAARTFFHMDPVSEGHGLDPFFYADGARFLVEHARKMLKR